MARSRGSDDFWDHQVPGEPLREPPGPYRGVKPEGGWRRPSPWRPFWLYVLRVALLVLLVAAIAVACT